MKNKKMLVVVFVAVIALLVAACAAPPTEGPPTEGPPTEGPPTEGPPETAKIGFLEPLSGPAAGWGFPGLTLLNIFVDEINAAGGLQVGENRVLVEIVTYDSEFIPSKALIGAKKLVLEDDVDVILMVTGACVDAVTPFLNEEGVLLVNMEVFDTAPERPFVISGGENWPMYHAIHLTQAINDHPEVETAAYICQDDVIGLGGAAWAMAAFEEFGVEVVHENLFSFEVIDFAPVISAALATNPDLVSLGPAYPEYRVLLMEQLYLQGFEGVIESSEWEISEELAVVPGDYLVQTHCYGHHPFSDDPNTTPMMREYYAKWLARYGPGAPEDVGRPSKSIDWLATSQAMLWAYGVEGAGTLDDAAVIDWLLAQENIPLLQGTANWWGEEVFGVNHHALTSQSVSSMEWVDGEVLEVLIDTYSISEWYNEHGQNVNDWMIHYGVHYTQR